MKKLYFVCWEDGDGIDRDEVLVMDDHQSLDAQVRRYFERRELIDEETGERWYRNARHYELGAFDADGREYEIGLRSKLKLGVVA